MIKNLLLHLIVFLFLTCSCQSQMERELRKSLETAGENRKNLEKVLQYYSNQTDVRKLDAAKFLIRNMQFHYSVVSPELDRYYDLLDSVSQLTPTRWSISGEQDSLFRTLVFPDERHIKRVYDNQMIDSDALIRHIDDMFAMYDTAVWCKGVDFETFCEYLLPYRVANEKMDLGWSSFFREKVEERASRAYPGCKTIQDTLYTLLSRMSSNYRISVEYKARYPYGYKPQQLYSLKRGTCLDYNILSCFMFRSVGIPMAMDYIPVWGNRSLGHDWSALFLSRAVIDTSAVLDYSFSAAAKPLGQYLSSNPNRPTKVYRTTFSRQSESLAMLHGEEEIPEEFESAFMKDVSAEYGLTHEASLELPAEERCSRYYYLCTFDNQRWVPVAWTSREGDRIRFTNLGGGIVYLPCRYEHHVLKAVAPPFVLHHDGKIRPLQPDGQQKQSMRLYRKYSSGEHIRRYSHLFEGGRLESSADATFRNPRVLYRFQDSISVAYQYIRLQEPVKSRYFRFVPREDKCGGEVADFQLLSSEGIRVYGQPIGAGAWESRHPLSAAFDSDVLTYAKSDSAQSAWVGVDLGRSLPISEIRLLPHNDDNFIRKGELYQLQCWDAGQWWIIEEKTGDERQYLQFDICPTNALFRLCNLTKGKEERIFTYDRGVQTWW